MIAPCRNCGKPGITGKMNRRITIQNPPVPVSDGQGGTIPGSWTSLVTVWAWIHPMSGGEQFNGQQIYPNALSKMTIRYLPATNINATMRVLYGNRTYNIRHVMVPDEAKITMELLCEELQARGSV